MTQIRTGQAPAPLTREQFRERFNGRFYDPAFEAEREAIARLAKFLEQYRARHAKSASVVQIAIKKEAARA